MHIIIKPYLGEEIGRGKSGFYCGMSDRLTDILCLCERGGGGGGGGLM